MREVVVVDGMRTAFGRLGGSLRGFYVTDLCAAVLKASIENKVPMHRLGQPAELAAAVAFLAGDDASWITGQTLFVSGGYRMP